MKNIFLFLFFLLSSNLPFAAENKFTSVYTDFSKDCKKAYEEEDLTGEDVPEICKGFGDYKIHITYSAVGAHALILNKEGDFTLDLSEHGMVLFKRKLEWRLKDRQPFAIILRTDEFEYGDKDVDTADLLNLQYKVGESLVVKGLKGFEHIDFRVDTKKQKNPNQQARDRADEAFFSNK